MAGWGINAIDLSEVSKECCQAWHVWERILSWCRLECRGKKRLVLPHIVYGGDGWTIRHCPSCGADRSQVVALDDGRELNDETQKEKHP